jgi:hypothetical protein
VTWQRGLFRLWLISTAAWLVGWALFMHRACHSVPGGKLLCEARPDGWFAHLGGFATWTYFKLLLLGISVPVGFLVLGIAVVWLVGIFNPWRTN